MNDQTPTNPHGLPVPSPAVPGRDQHPGKAFENAPADIWTSNDCRVIAIDGDYFSRSHFHTLKEYRDWEGLMRGEVDILGRVFMDHNFLDLVVTTKEGHLLATSISYQEVKALHPDIQHFLQGQRKATPILTRENPHVSTFNTHH